MLKRFRERKSVDRVLQDRRRSGTYDRKLNQKVLRTVRANPGLSDNEITRKFDFLNCSRRFWWSSKGACSSTMKHTSKWISDSFMAKNSIWRRHEEMFLRSLNLLSWTRFPKQCSWQIRRCTRSCIRKNASKTAIYLSLKTIKVPWSVARFGKFPLKPGSHPVVPR